MNKCITVAYPCQRFYSVGTRAPLTYHNTSADRGQFNVKNGPFSPYQVLPSYASTRKWTLHLTCIFSDDKTPKVVSTETSPHRGLRHAPFLQHWRISFSVIPAKSKSRTVWLTKSQLRTSKSAQRTFAPHTLRSLRSSRSDGSFGQRCLRLLTITTQTTGGHRSLKESGRGRQTARKPTLTVCRQCACAFYNRTSENNSKNWPCTRQTCTTK